MMAAKMSLDEVSDVMGMKSPTMAGHLIRRLNQISTQTFAHHMQEHGIALTPVQFAAMDAIHSNPDIDQASVAARIAYDKATIGGVIDRLVQKGYVERSVSKNDRRARALRLSKTGANLFDVVMPIVSGLQDDILPGLNETEREMFLKLAARIVAAPG